MHNTVDAAVEIIVGDRESTVHPFESEVKVNE